jgi:RNA polymerase sigma-70 factor (ECF subfamily)
MRHPQDMSFLLARRQERAFERLYRRHVADVYRYALVVLGDAQHAESVTQATFVRAYRAYRGGERPQKKTFNWLLGIAHQVCGHRSRGIEAALPEELLEEDSTPTPSDIRRALDVLGYDERAALMMREVERRSLAEIAEFLELGPGEVEVLIFRARKALREQLERSLTCDQAERAISRQLDGLLSRSERKLLRAHLCACPECEDFAQSQRKHRAALRSFGLVPLPKRLGIFGGRSLSLGPVARTAAIVAIALMTGGVVAGGVDPRQWGHDATHIQPADAATPPVVKRKVAPRVAKQGKRKTSRRRPDR